MSDVSLSEAARRALLGIAREQIRASLGPRGALPAPGRPDEPDLLAGAFVSLHVAGRLRGCIGTFDTTRPVAEQVRQMAVAASTRDPRFPPLGPEELDAVDIEISVLTPPRPVADPSEVEVGRHGIVVTRGHRRGVLLPQVASDHGWDRETFLAHTCVKAGLPPDAWKDPETELEVFEAEVFGEARESSTPSR